MKFQSAHLDLKSRATLDDFDKRLLAQLQRNCRRPAEEMGRQIGLSASAVQKRLKRLRDEGYIAREVALVTPRATPDAMLFIVRIEIQRGAGHLLAEFEKRMKEAPEALQCFHVTGDADFILVVATKGMQDYEQFSRVHFLESGLVSRYETSVVMRTLKLGFELPL